MGQIGCPDTSVTRYKSTLFTILEERRSQIHRGGSLFHSSVLFKRWPHFGCLRRTLRVCYWSFSLSSVWSTSVTANVWLCHSCYTVGGKCSLQVVEAWKYLKLWGPLVLSVNNRTKQSKETCSVVSQTGHVMINVTTCFCLRGLRPEVWTSLSLRILVFWFVRLLDGLIDSRLFDASYRRYLTFSTSQNSRTRQSHSYYCIRYWYWYSSVQ